MDGQMIDRWIDREIELSDDKWENQSRVDHNNSEPTGIEKVLFVYLSVGFFVFVVCFFSMKNWITAYCVLQTARVHKKGRMKEQTLLGFLGLGNFEFYSEVKENFRRKMKWLGLL